MRAARQASTSGLCYFYERSRSLDYVIRPEIHHHSIRPSTIMLGDGGSESTRLAFRPRPPNSLFSSASARMWPRPKSSIIRRSIISREAGSVVGWHRYLEAKVGLGSDLPARLCAYERPESALRCHPTHSRKWPALHPKRKVAVEHRTPGGDSSQPIAHGVMRHSR